MPKAYSRLDKNNAAVLLVDHQAGLLSLVVREVDHTGQHGGGGLAGRGCRSGGREQGEKRGQASQCRREMEHEARNASRVLCSRESEVGKTEGPNRRD